MIGLKDALTASDLQLDSRVAQLLLWFDNFAIDCGDDLQDRLNLTKRVRTSLFPWRGQFSPQLVEFLLAQYARPDSVVADPFVGSGTTLFEAARRGLACLGAEINPAAIIMANTVQFVNLAGGERLAAMQAARRLLELYVPLRYPDGLFAALNTLPDDDLDLYAGLYAALAEVCLEPTVHNLLANALLRFMALPQQDPGSLYSAYKEQTNIVEQLPFSKQPYAVLHTDARALPIPTNTVDLIITSPPYINVFNYHQNHRRAMELLGWNVLKVARSEFGSNRKHRSNRFLTVVQYALDMMGALREMRRILKVDGRIIIIIGRASNVRGTPFQNGKLVAALAQGGAGLQLVLRQERAFKTKFGEIIYEDLLHFVPASVIPSAEDDLPRRVARYLLYASLQKAPVTAQADILAAVNQASLVNASPLFMEQTRLSQNPQGKRDLP